MDQSGKLVSADKLRGYFNPPLSLRTIRNWQKRRHVPFIKVGGKVFFDPERVMDHLKQRNEIKPRQ
jgi:hypothetical protein